MRDGRSDNFDQHLAKIKCCPVFTAESRRSFAGRHINPDRRTANRCPPRRHQSQDQMRRTT
jgi:hypothetical protein